MGEADPLAGFLESIAAEFDVAMGRPEKVRADCARLRERLARPPTVPEVERLCRLAPLLRQRAGPIAAPLFEHTGLARADCRGRTGASPGCRP